MTEAELIRRAAMADLPELCRLAELLGTQHAAYDPVRYRVPTLSAYADFFREQLTRDDAGVLVAELSGDLLGYAFVRIEPASLEALCGPAGWIHDLYVAEAGRGRGIGGRLLDAAIQTLGDLGATDVMLGVAAQNAAAAALFRRRGFRPTLQEMSLHLGPHPRRS